MFQKNEGGGIRIGILCFYPLTGERRWKARHFGNGWPSGGCRFDRHEHHERGKGQVLVTVLREGRTSQAPLGGSRQDLDPRDVRRVCEELGLEWSELPGAIQD